MPYRHQGWRWVATTLTPHQAADGSIDSVIALTRDIGERKIAERERQDLLERERAMREEVEILYRLTDAMTRVRDLEGVFEPALDAVLAALHVDRASILLFDPDRVMRFKAWRGLSDRYRAAVEGHSPWTPDSIDPEPEFSPDVEADPALERYQGVFRDEGVRALGFFPLISAHRVIGKFMVYDSKPRTLSDREIRIARTIATHVAQGVARQRAFEEAEQQRQRAETAGRAKDEFLAMVSHELRTPLTAVVGWTHMLVTGAVPEAKRAKALETIDRNAHLQMQLVEDLLDFSRITTGKVRLHLSRLDFADVVVHVLESFRPAAEAKGIALEFAVEGNVGTIEGDVDRIQQIVWNLVSNAVKFTPRGGTVRVELRRGDSEVTVTVEDDGDGIDPAFMPFVFERFRQGDAGAARTRGGLGLGLAIVRHLAELHGGSVTVASPGRGRGSTFRVSLPSVLRAPPSA
jgi:signal transduction histidine kinase